MGIFMMLILLVHEHSICFHLLVFPKFFSSVSYSFLSTCLLSPWLNLSLGTLFFVVVVIVNAIVFLVSLVLLKCPP